MLPSDELRRYSRHLLIPEVGIAGQERFRAARVLCIGAGGLGSAALSYLAAAGVGCIGIVDDDRVDLSNLQRQILFATQDVGTLKVDAAHARLLAINPHLEVRTYAVRATIDNVRALVRDYDIVIDGSDSFSTRYLVNDACVLEKKANVFASIYRFEAQITVFGSTARPCYRCLFPQIPPVGSVPSCAEGGVLGAVAGLAGVWQAIETMKQILHIGERLSARLLLVDTLTARSRELALEADPACIVCGATPSLFDVRDEDVADIRPASDRGEEVAPEDMQAALARGYRLLDVREPHEAVLGGMPGALHIPYSQLATRLGELSPSESYLVACRLGQRSRFAVAILRRAGFADIAHLDRGLLAVAALEEAEYLF